MSEHQFDERRIALDEAREAHEFELAQARLELERHKTGRFSAGAVSIIGSIVAVVSAVGTALISGLFTLQTTESNNDASFGLKQEEVRGNLEIKRIEVDGQMKVQRLIAQAEKDRLATEQKFKIIVQATKGLPTDTASENLKFFVEAGILDDPGDKILGLAEQGKAPDLPALQTNSGGSNPLIERLSRLERSSKTLAAESAATFRIEDGLVLSGGDYPVSHVETPNHSGTIDPRYIVLHSPIGVGDDLIRMMTSNKIKASAHIIVRRDGSLVQLLPLDYKAWHAGRSKWGTLMGLNQHSIGIEIENWGPLKKSGGNWKPQLSDTIIPDDEVVEAAHKSGGPAGGWHKFTDKQIASLTELLLVIRASDSDIVDVIGHDDISPGRKLDPGPALPLEQIRERVFGHRAALEPPR